MARCFYIGLFYLKFIAFIHQRFSKLLKIIQNKFCTFNSLGVYLH